MKIFFNLFTTAILLYFFSAKLDAQCSGGRYHDLVFSGAPVVTSNVVYGSNLDQNGATVSLKLDIYEPACDVATNRSLIIFAHGGGFVAGDKSDAGYVQAAIGLAKLGYVVASINYRLGFPTSGLPAQYGFNSAIMRGLHDGRAAVRFMRNNALNGGNTYKIDPNNIYFSGASAGAIIALHLAYQNLQGEMTLNCGGQPGTDQSSIEGNSNALTVASTVKAIVAVSGGIRSLSWIATNDIPVCLAHGTNDGTVPYGSGSFGGFFPIEGSSTIATRCNTTGTTYCFKPMYGQDHVPANTAYNDTLATITRNFLEKFVCNTTLNCNYTTSPAVIGSSVAIAITSGTNPTCSGTSVTFTATPTNGGGSPSYQWKKNGVNVGTNISTYSSSTFASNDVITCVLTPCTGSATVTSNSITMTISSVSAPSAVIALTTGSNPSCSATALTFTVTPTNGGTTPSFQWKKNGVNVGTNTTSYSSSTLASNDIISCLMTSNSSCASPLTATSNSITMTINTVIPTITKIGNVLTSSSLSGNQWYLNGVLIAGATNQNYTATQSGSYTVKVGGCQSIILSVIITDIDDFANNDFLFTVFPNPNNGSFNISFNALAKENYKLELINVIGESVYQEILPEFKGIYSKQIDIGKYGKGIYMIHLSTSKKEVVKKIVVY